MWPQTNITMVCSQTLSHYFCTILLHTHFFSFLLSIYLPLPVVDVVRRCIMYSHWCKNTPLCSAPLSVYIRIFLAVMSESSYCPPPSFWAVYSCVFRCVSMACLHMRMLPSSLSSRRRHRRRRFFFLLSIQHAIQIVSGARSERAAAAAAASAEKKNCLYSCGTFMHYKL